MLYRIIECIDEMRFRSQQNDIFDVLGGRKDLDHISGERRKRIALISDHKKTLLDPHGDDLIIDGRVVEITSQEEKDQYRSDDIIIEQREHEYACEYHSEDEISDLSPFEFLSVIDTDAHSKTMKRYKKAICV